MCRVCPLHVRLPATTGEQVGYQEGLSQGEQVAAGALPQSATAGETAGHQENFLKVS